MDDPKHFLWHVKAAAEDIEEFLAGLDIDAYRKDKLVKAGVERKFEVIGEALNALSKRDPVLASRIGDLPSIVAFRNKLIHGYAVINPEIVYNLARARLPELRRNVAALLLELDAS